MNWSKDSYLQRCACPGRHRRPHQMERYPPGTQKGWSLGPTSLQAFHIPPLVRSLGPYNKECPLSEGRKQNRIRTTIQVLAQISTEEKNQRLTSLSVNSWTILISGACWTSGAMLSWPIFERPKSVTLMWPVEVINMLQQRKAETCVMLDYTSNSNSTCQIDGTDWWLTLQVSGPCEWSHSCAGILQPWSSRLCTSCSSSGKNAPVPPARRHNPHLEGQEERCSQCMLGG